MDAQTEKQVAMHKDFFSRTRFALEHRFYLEAIILEYAAIESRLESICDTIGFPCGKNCTCRAEVKITSRIACIKSYKNKNKEFFKASKLPADFFDKNGALKTWLVKRNTIVHGLYKNAADYKNKIKCNQTVAEDGFEIARLLYNEAKRSKSLKKNHPEVLINTIPLCKNKTCKANTSVSI